MKFLFVSNRYPPDAEGGYEIRLFHLVAALRVLGHACAIVTRTRPSHDTSPDSDEGVFRILECQSNNTSSPTGRLSNIIESQKNAIRLSQIIRAFEPDWVCHFNLGGMSPALMTVAPLHSVPQACWIEDTWLRAIPTHGGAILNPWFQIHNDRPKTRLTTLSPLIRPWIPAEAPIGRSIRLKYPVEMQLGLFVSHYQEWQNRTPAVSFGQKSILPAGIPLPSTRHAIQPIPAGEPIRLLYAGALTPDRGIPVLWEALESMTGSERDGFKLTLAGKAPNEWAQRFWESFRQSTSASPVWNITDAIGHISHDTMEDLLRRHDILVFPSQREEGRPLIMQEAMANGCHVIASGSGGSAELCMEAGLPTYPANSPAALKAELLHQRVSPSELLEERKRLLEFAHQSFSMATTATAFLNAIDHMP